MIYWEAVIIEFIYCWYCEVLSHSAAAANIHNKKFYVCHHSDSSVQNSGEKDHVVWS